eukprot:664706-Prymnesium_polylepis.1
MALAGCAVIANDFDATTLGQNWIPGTFSGCHDSHSGDNPEIALNFHHDNASNKGGVRATYRPRLPVGGCWEVDEWHPGGSEICSSYLPSRVPVDILTVDGVLREYIDQSVRPNRWNPIGRFMLSADAAQIVSSNEGTTTCAAAPCFWVADAFRLSYVGPTCDEPAAAIASCPPPQPFAPPAGPSTLLALRPPPTPPTALRRGVDGARSGGDASAPEQHTPPPPRRAWAGIRPPETGEENATQRALAVCICMVLVLGSLLVGT